jgi:hypothetical protein
MRRGRGEYAREYACAEERRICEEREKGKGM